jgi:biofilm PGA synthesis N-glycosyltransferase PgaC
MTVLAGFVFVFSAAVLLYVIAGYPLLLHWMARGHSRPVHKDDVLRTVSVVIAVRNGVKFAADKLNSVLALRYPPELIEIIVVSDGSDDGTDEVVAQFRSRGVQLFRVPRGGKGSAVNAGIARARNEILILTDIRQRLHPDSLRNLVACFGDPEVGAVSGELSILRGDTEEEADTGLYWKYEMWMRRGMSAIHSTFGTNGPFYGLRRSLAVSIPPDTLLDDVYLPLAGYFAGKRIVLEESAKVLDYPTSLQSEFRRKVRTQAGLYQTLRLYPQLLTRRNPMRLHFASGKFGRLLMPWALVLMAASSLALPNPLRLILLIAQSCFYLMALLDLLLPEGWRLKRFTSPIRTFVVLMIAAALAVRVFFVPARELWKETQVRKVENPII